MEIISRYISIKLLTGVGHANTWARRQKLNRDDQEKNGILTL